MALDVEDLESLEPTTISNDLKGKYVLLYGPPKIGKTTMAASFPRTLLLATEIGYHAIGNIHAVDIASWVQFKRYLKQLEKPGVRSRFDTIVIDTAAILGDLCEAFICSQLDVEDFSEVAWGKAYKAFDNEFARAIRKIQTLGYGIVFIAHSEVKVEKDSNGQEIERMRPALNKRIYRTINQLVDIIGFIGTNEQGERMIYTRSTPFIMAGSRYPHLAEEIPFGYDSLAKALNDAVAASVAEGMQVSNGPVEMYAQDKPDRTFDETMREAREVYQKLDDLNDSKLLDQVDAIIVDYFNDKDFRLSQATPSQQSIVEGVILEMKELLEKQH